MEYDGRRVTVFGLGSFGGGVGAVKFLAARGARVTVTDLKPAAELAHSLSEISGIPGLELHLGGHRESDVLDSELFVVSPGVPRNHPYVALAARRGIPITSEMNLFWSHNRGRIMGITGSNGKSTTTALAHAMLSANPRRRTWMGGNIGRSLLPQVDEIQPEDWVVLELSSFQLEDLAAEFPSPAPVAVSLVTNFSPNHLDRHGTLECYRRAKQVLPRTQTAEGIAVLNADDADVREWSTPAERLCFGWHDAGQPGVFALDSKNASTRRRALVRTSSDTVEFPLGEWLTLPGSHNFENAMAAACASLAIGATLNELETGLRGFSGLPHRLEFVAERAGRTFYNDSKATTPAAACLALEAFDRPIVLLAGGYDKQIDLAGLANKIGATKLRGLVLLGQTAPELNRLLQQQDSATTVPRHLAGNFEEACNCAALMSQPGDVVLLSPGCASYDWFANYEDRGTAFKHWVRHWPGPASESEHNT